MTSAASNPNQANQPTLQINNAASPPSKRDLKSWWKGFKLPSKHQEPQGMVSSSPTTSCATLLDQCLESVQQNDLVSLLNTSGDALQCRNQVF